MKSLRHARKERIVRLLNQGGSNAQDLVEESLPKCARTGPIITIAVVVNVGLYVAALVSSERPRADEFLQLSPPLWLGLVAIILGALGAVVLPLAIRTLLSYWSTRVALRSMAELTVGRSRSNTEQLRCFGAREVPSTLPFFPILIFPQLLFLGFVVAVGTWHGAVSVHGVRYEIGLSDSFFSWEMAKKVEISCPRGYLSYQLEFEGGKTFELSGASLKSLEKLDVVHEVLVYRGVPIHGVEQAEVQACLVGAPEKRVEVLRRLFSRSPASS